MQLKDGIFLVLELNKVRTTMFDIIREIGAITREIQIKSNAEFRKQDLGNNAFLYVIRVNEKPGMFLGELADSVQIDRTTAFRTVKKLVAKGYLELKDDEADRRMKKVYATSKGQEIYPELHAFEVQQSAALLSNLTSAEQEQLKQL